MKNDPVRRSLALLMALCMILAMAPLEAAASSTENEVFRTQWSAATVVEAGETANFTLDTYSSSYTADQIWLAVNAAENQAIQMALSGNAKSMFIAIYSAATLGSSGPTSKNYLQSFSTSGNSTFSYAVPSAGAYYIMLRPGNSSETTSNLRSMTITLNEGDHNESNNTWKTATELTENVNTYFTLHGCNDRDWFKITTTVPGEAIKLVLSNFNYTVDDVRAAIFSGAELTTATGSVSSLTYKDFTTSGTLLYKIDEPGDYYVFIYPRYTTDFVTRELKVRYELVPGDANEINDTRAGATLLNNNVDTPFTLNGINDVDWFTFETTEPNQLMYLYITGFETDYSNHITYTVYDLVDGVLTKVDTYNPDINVLGKSFNFENTGTHYIKITPYSTTPVENELNLRIDLRQSQNDDCEPNDTWQQATPLAYGAGQAFTLPSSSDVDWFCFTTTEPNQTLKLTFSNVPSGGSVYPRLYSGTALEQSGSSASYMTSFTSTGSGSATYYYMLGAAGTYYIRTKANDPSIGSVQIFSDPATIKYELVEPDANERNNTWKTATALTESVDTAFTLPASNDVDWFCFTVTEPNQTLKLTFSNVPSGGSVWPCLYSGTALTEDGDSASYMTSFTSTGSGSATYYYMLGAAGTYYIRTKANDPSIGSVQIFSDPATIKYELIEPDANERNNYLGGATPLAAGSAKWFTLPASNDYDWFRLDNLQVGDQITVTLGNMQGSGSISGDVYVLKEGETSGTRETSLSFYRSYGTQSTTAKIKNAGTHYLRLSYSGHIANSMYVRYTVTRDQVAVTGISLQTTAETLPVGKTLLLNTSITPYYASNQSVTWTSSAESVATVDANGMVTAVAPGTATIKVTTSDGGYSASCVVTVTAAVRATGVTIDKTFTETAPKSLALNTSLQLYATLQPENATNQTVTWTSSDEKVLAVTSYGKVTALGSGKAYITATTEDGSHTARTWFSVPDETYPVTRVTLNKSNLTIYMAEDGETLTATVAPSYATNQAVTWSSSDTSIATVDQNGKVTAVSQGYAVITAAAEENPAVKAECRVSVQPQRVHVQGISFDRESLDLGLYTEIDLAPSFTPTTATVKTLTWSSDNTTVATVTRTGKVYTVGLGYANITATSEDGGFTATIRINVSPSAQKGDVSENGLIDAADALLILQYSVGLRAFSAAQKALADVSDDGLIDAADAILVLRYAAGLIDAFPAR